MTNPYDLWDTRRSLGVMRDVKSETQFFRQYFTQVFSSTDEYIDFEKLPIMARKLAPFALPLARGGSIYSDSAKTYRFKPAYVKVEDSIDPLMPLTKRAGIDSSMLNTATLTPMQRINLIKAQMTGQHVMAIERTWEWLAARAIIDGQVTLTGPNYPTTLVNFGRDAGHTVILTSGNRWGDSGVSIFSSIQAWLDTMNNAEFGALPTRLVMGQDVWNVLRKDAEFKEHLDNNYRNPAMTIERGLVSGGANGGKMFPVGNMSVGGAGGATIELWVNNETYVDPNTGTTTRYLGAKEMVLLGSPESVMGYQCFGMIVDRAAEYQALPIFPANWLQGNNPTTEWIGHTSSPLMVPIAPNATFKATVVA
jgi:Phage major capsid protein E